MGAFMDKTTVLFLGALISQVALTNPVLADEVPQFDVQKNCNIDVSAYGSGQTKAACIADEQKAKATLVAQWTRFSAASRSRCLTMVGDIAGGTKLR